jgi:hypothetical protein
MMEDKPNLFGPIFQKLDKMDKSNEVNLSILDDLTALERQLSGFEKECIAEKDRKVEDAFLLFHVMRSSRMILEKTRARFEEAKMRHENPIVVDVPKMVVPRLNELYNLVTPIFKDKKHVLLPSERSAILRRLKIMRDIASATSLLPSVEDEKKGVLKGNLRREFEGLADTLQASTDEE